MTPVLSVWLDICRIVAALFVFVGHAVGMGLASEAMSLQWHRSADDAVTAFFVISGLVIAHTSAQRPDQGWRAYALARMSRVYSVAIPAVLFVLALDHLGMQIDASKYTPDWQYPRLWLYLPLHWAFLGETWLGVFQPFTAAPYWSLTYEVWYYALFGALYHLRGLRRCWVAALIFLIMGPRIWLLLPIWWLGVGLHGRLAVLTCAKPVAWLMMAAFPLAYALFLSSGAQHQLDLASKALYAWLDGVLPFRFYGGSSVHALSDYPVALMFAMFLVGCANSGLGLSPRVRACVKWGAGYTFTFYLLHFSVIVFCLALGWSQLGGWAMSGVLLGTMVLSWLHAQVGEQRRVQYRGLIDRLLPGRMSHS